MNIVDKLDYPRSVKLYNYWLKVKQSKRAKGKNANIITDLHFLHSQKWLQYPKMEVQKGKKVQ